MKNSFNPFKVFYIEIWKEHPIYTNYEASNFGNIRSLNYNKTGKTKEIKQCLHTGGYPYFTVCVDGKSKKILSHRFIWECWNNLIPEGLEIDHIDTDRTNNSLSNLRQGTPKENSNNVISCKHRSEILTNNKKLSKTVLQYSLQGEFIKEYPSSWEVQRETGYNRANISNCCRGIQKTAYGFLWSYAV